jgi:predicted Zn finger-like uncharacterized protein
MPIQVVCPSCKTSYTLREEVSGKKVRCKKCQEAFVATSTPAAEEAEELEEDPIDEPRRPSKKRRSRPESDDEDEERPRRRRPKKKQSVLVPVLIVGGIALLVLLFVGVAAFVIYRLVTDREMPVTDQDLAVVLTADRLASRTDLPVHPEQGSIRKRRKSTGEYVITYVCGSPAEAAKQSGIYLECQVTVAPNVIQAQHAYVQECGFPALGPDWEGKNEPKKTERRDLFQWGDESQSLLLTRGVKFPGNVLTARKDKKVFHLVLLGFAVLDGDWFPNLLEPVLKALDGYTP